MNDIFGNNQEPYRQFENGSFSQKNQESSFASDRVVNPGEMSVFNGVSNGSTPVQVASPVPEGPTRKKTKIGLLIACVVLLAIIAISVASCAGAASTMMNAATSSLSPRSGSQLGALNRDAVAVIEMSGTIQYDGTSCSPEGLSDLLDQAQKNGHVKAIVLRVDSGGGTATAGEEMAAYVRDCELPIVVSSASLNASAAYEISSQADYIFTAKTTTIGSIGTVMQVADYSGLLSMLGISVDNISSSPGKDSSYGMRPLTEEERAYYQNMVNQINEEFIKLVAEGRNLDIETVRALANGMIYTGLDAVNNGLADEIGSLEDALDTAASLADIEEYEVVYLDVSANGSGMANVLGALGEAGGVTVEINPKTLEGLGSDAIRIR